LAIGGATFENMVGIAAEHATHKIKRVSALELEVLVEARTADIRGDTT
jgi:hypothetical protein